MITAFVLISVNSGAEKVAVEKLQKIDEIRLVHEVYGEWDIIAKIEVSDIRNLDGIISLKIRKMPEVKLTSTMVVAG